MERVFSFSRGLTQFERARVITHALESASVRPTCFFALTSAISHQSSSNSKTGLIMMMSTFSTAIAWLLLVPNCHGFTVGSPHVFPAKISSLQLRASTLAPTPVKMNGTDATAWECDEDANCVQVPACDEQECRTSLDVRIHGKWYDLSGTYEQ